MSLRELRSAPSSGRTRLDRMIGAHRHRVYAAAAFLALLAHGAQADERLDVWSRVDTARVCPIAAVWRLGVEAGRARYEAIETVAPLEVDGRTVWRITHTMLRWPEDLRSGSVPGFDFFDLERATLRPLQSEHRAPHPADSAAKVTRFDYRAATVLRLNPDGSPAESIELEPGQRLLADGPGNAVMDQAIAWSDGLRLRSVMLDRWRGQGAQRVRPVEITVTGRGSVEIRGRRIETYVVTERPEDGSFHVVSQITVERPHHRVHVQYYAAGLKNGARAFVSEVAALLQDASCVAQLRPHDPARAP